MDKMLCNTINLLVFQSQHPNPHFNVGKCYRFMFSMQVQAVLHLINYSSTLIPQRGCIFRSVTLVLSTIVGSKWLRHDVDEEKEDFYSEKVYKINHNGTCLWTSSISFLISFNEAGEFLFMF